MRRAAGGAMVLVLAGGAMLAGACGDDEASGPGGQGGAGSTSVAVTTAGVTTGGPSSTSTGPTGCDACPAELPICFNDTCVAMCPSGQASCNADPGNPLSCCGLSEQCCPGLQGAGLCAPGDRACPLVCPDGSTCGDGERCQLDVYSGMYGCTDDCAEQSECGTGICCPLGSRCENGSCPLPDLAINQEQMASSAYVTRQTFSASSCSLMEGCLGAAGERRLLKFDLGTPNYGDGDLFLGAPSENEHFEYSTCHDHFHFKGYARYTLLDANNAEVGNGEKHAFCLLDYEPWDPAAGEAQYHCGFQGISKGWADIYGSHLACQWIDVTDIPPGSYTLVAEVNFDQLLGESDYSNNTASIPFVIEQETCTSGCGTNDPACCGDTDACGLAGNGFCDCGGFQPWDYDDCEVCSQCNPGTTCQGGCTPPDDACCDPANPCGLGTDGICQCAGTQAWDAVDCGQCVSADADCATVDSCPEGCPDNSGNQCCADATVDTCGWASDGYCDCNGIGWDFLDCSSCACN